MEQKSSAVISTKSQVNYDYATIKITQSRIDKGLIAIPVSLTDKFPVRSGTIQIYLNDSPDSKIKTYSSYTSSTRECRIGGVKEWFEQNKIKRGDEIVIQFIDREHFIYRLIPEKNFISKTQELQKDFDSAETEKEAVTKVQTLTDWTQSGKGLVLLSEFNRLTNTVPSEERQVIRRSSGRVREGVPASIRVLLEGIYHGHCQICDFWFLKKDNKPYFEIHHLDALRGHHPKNLVVVCGNCHNQFEHTLVRQGFDTNSWLIWVAFNETKHVVKQALLDKKLDFSKKLYV